VFLQARLDAVGANRDVHSFGFAGCEFQLRRVSALFEADATTTRAYRGRREGPGEYSEQIGSVHSIDAIPAARVGSDDTSNKRSIHPVESRALTYLGSDLRQRLTQSHSFKLTPAVRKEGKASADLAERINSLPNGNVDTPSKHCVRRR
jgi:hypothetical protein